MRYLLALLLLTLTAALVAQTDPADYAKLKAYVEAGKYQSALTIADSIYARAARGGQSDELLRALGERVTLTQLLAEDEQEAALGVLREALSTQGQDPVVAALTHLMLGEVYSNYAQQNQYRLSQVTEVAGQEVSDSLPLADYTLQQLLAAGRNHLYHSLTLAREQQTRLAEIPALVVGGETRRDELPTLYDLLVGRAMDLLSSSLGSLTDDRPLDAAELLVPAGDFCDLNLAARYDTTQATPRKLLLYQEWISFHLNEVTPALLYADLERLRYVHQLGAADSLYIRALEQAYERYTALPERDRFLVEMARLLDRDDVSLGELPRVRALALLERAGEEDEVARVEAVQLRASITAATLSTQTHSHYPRGEHLLVYLIYRNVEQVYYRLYSYDPARPADYIRDVSERLAEIQQGELVGSGSQRLAPNDDYSQHTTELDLATLPAGGYYLVVSDSENFDPEAGTFTVSDFQVTDLSTLKVSSETGGPVQVVDRTTGAAVADVRVEVYRSNRRDQDYRLVYTRRSDDDGVFTLPAPKDYAQYRLVLTHASTGDRLVTNLYTYNNRSGGSLTQTYTTLLTDRPLYRPGQLVHVYGLQYQTGVDQLPSILPEVTVTVILRDANYQEVAQQQAITDAYGRFSVDFELPESGLTGEFSIQTDNGNAAIRVEEYKRPRFEVTLEAPEAAVPGQPVTVRGEALTYAGPPVTDARVNYRVYLEEVRWYFYRGYGGDGGGGERELVTSGETTSGEQGEFNLTFTPSASLGTTGYPSYRYVIETDVADQTGETHTATTTVGIRGERPAVVVTVSKETLDRGDSLTIRAQTDQRDTTLAIQLRITPVTKLNASLLERDWPVPDRPVIERDSFVDHFPYLSYAAVPELAEWPTDGDSVYQTTATLRQGTATVSLPADFPAGHYRIDWRYADGTAGAPAAFSVYNSATAELPAGTLYQFTDVPDSVRVDEPINFTLLSALDLPLVLSRWESRSGLVLERDSTTARRLTLRYTPTEADRGGLFHQLAFVRLNRVFQESRQLPLPWENKALHVTYATFRSKLRPGTPEEWTLQLKSNDSLPAAAAALATMYDASLDQLYAGQGWQFSPYPVYGGSGSLVENASFGSAFGESYGNSAGTPQDTIPQLPYLNLTTSNLTNQLRGKAASISLRSRMTMPENAAPEVQDAALSEVVITGYAEADEPSPTSAAPAAPPISAEPPVDLRTNLQETAFWLPDLTAGPDGSLRVTFTSPEALTAWKFRLFAHDKALNYVISQREVMTQKELMVLPNAPRFLREGDQMELTAKVSNLTDLAMDVRIDLELFNPDGSEVVRVESSGASELLRLEDSSSATVRFPISVPDGASLDGPLGYRIIARSGSFSDGEENVVPILSDRTLLTVSQPFYLRRGETKEVILPGLLPSSPVSPSLAPISYTLQATTNPAWLALKALPYLMEYPYDCTEQLANRYFANQLAYQTVSTKPVLKEVFNQWEADSTALLSELEKNQDLKTALLTETPWVRAAQSEAEQRARIGELFQLERLAREQQKDLAKLAARQESDGAYSWFPGGPSDRYMTQYVVETIARMQQLGVIDPAQRATVDQITTAALRYLDRQLEEDYKQLLAETKDSTQLRQDYQPTPLQLHYLYARTLIEEASAPSTKAFDFYRERAFAEWLSYGLYEQALIAITMAHSPSAGRGRGEVILASLRERALHKDEFGMYWKYEQGYSWNELPIETHTRLLEAFRTIDPRPEELDEMRLYLLTNKRTTAWPTTKATAAAVYAILNSGETFTIDQPTQPITASWPGRTTKALSTRVRALQETAEAATGEFTLRVPAEQVSSDLATTTIANPGNDLVWGGVFWQYTELADRVEASHTGPLSLERTLYKKVGDQLQPITEDAPLHPGDRITVRLTLRSDRAMDYVHVKDRRAATFEPVDALSGYQYQNGLGYYFTPGDLATNFFIDHLPRGTYTLEYDLFATYVGSFSSGLGRVECMYAPEFGGNSSGNRVSVE